MYFKKGKDKIDIFEDGFLDFRKDIVRLGMLLCAIMKSLYAFCWVLPTIWRGHFYMYIMYGMTFFPDQSHNTCM